MHVLWRRLVKVVKCGNGLAIRLPAVLVTALGLKESDEIEVQVASRRKRESPRKSDARVLLGRLRKYRGQIPADFKFDRLEANERG